MDYRTLGRTDLKVSAICLGTMTWGEQNTVDEAHEQLDFALDHGVNFIDTAEMYPVPPKAETVHRTEEYIGKWLKGRSDRDKLIVATKVTGRSAMDWMRGGPRLSRTQIEAAVDASLGRLQTDHIDLYQVHWPERATNFFGRLGYEHADDPDTIAIEETHRVLDDLVMSGKVRHVGLSNETPWGVMQYLLGSAERGLVRPVSIQNPYSLLNRTFEVGLAEMAIRENVGLLAYSPLGFGTLSGKYRHGQKPKGARLTEFARFQRYNSEEAVRATEAYCRIAEESGLDPAQMALAFVTSRPFVTANIIGATSLEQLRSNIESAKLILSADVLAAIEGVHKGQPNPAP